VFNKFPEKFFIQKVVFIEQLSIVCHWMLNKQILFIIVAILYQNFGFPVLADFINHDAAIGVANKSQTSIFVFQRI
jgi:hypothetical protein